MNAPSIGLLERNSERNTLESAFRISSIGAQKSSQKLSERNILGSSFLVSNIGAQKSSQRFREGIRSEFRLRQLINQGTKQKTTLKTAATMRTAPRPTTAFRGVPYPNFSFSSALKGEKRIINPRRRTIIHKMGVLKI
jgi:hypothetical protein